MPRASRFPPAIQKKLKPGSEIVTGYTLVKPLGGGGEGDVWVARAPGNIEVAIKLISLSKLLGREGLKGLKTMLRIKHANLCEMSGIWAMDASGKLLKDVDTGALLPESSADNEFVNDESDTIEGRNEPVLGTLNIQPDPSRSGPDPSKETDSRSLRKEIPDAEVLIVAMRLGDQTLSDRLREIREHAGLKRDKTKACGMEIAVALRFVEQASEGIDELNKQKILHRDIKPQNILIVGSSVQVCDFGLAKRIQGNAHETQHTFASPAYAPPETLNENTYHRTIDQYSLAVTYFELRTGLLPFDGTTANAQTFSKCLGKLNLAHVTAPERKVLERALKVNPDERFASCGEFVRALRSAVQPEHRTRWVPLLASSAAVLLITLSALYFVWQTPQTGPGDPFNLRLGDASIALVGFEDAVDKGSTDARVQARTVVNQSLVAFKIADDSVEQQQVRELFDKPSQFLMKSILDELNSAEIPPSDDALKYISSDLELLVGLIAKDSTSASGAAGKLSDETEKLVRDGVALAQDQVEMIGLESKLQEAIGGADQSELDQNKLEEIRQSLSKLESNASKRRESGADTASVDKMIADKVITLRALTHYRRPSNTDAKQVNEHYQREGVIDDIAVAKIRWLSDTPPWPDWNGWQQQRWLELQSSSLQAISDVYQSPATSDLLKQTIREAWPAISDAIALQEMRQLLGDPSQLRSRLDAFKLTTEEHRDSARHAANRELLELMCQALESPRRAIEILKRLDQDKSLLDADFIASRFGDWVDALAQQQLQPVLSSELSMELALEFCTLAKRVCDQMASVHAQKSLNDVLLLAAVLSNDSRNLVLPEINAAVAAGASESRLLADGVKLEQAIGNPSARVPSFPRSFLDSDDVPDALSARPWLLKYWESLRRWGSNDRSAAADLWQELTTSASGSAGDSLTQLLGKDRCKQIASLLLQLATLESEVADNNLLRLRFWDKSGNKLGPGTQRVEQAESWLRESGEPPEESIEFAQQALLANIARKKLDPGSITNVKLRDQLSQLINLVTRNDPTFGRLNGQFLRGAFEIAKYTCDGTDADPNPPMIGQEDARLLLVWLADEILTAQLGNQEWSPNGSLSLIEEVAVPSIDQIQLIMKPRRNGSSSGSSAGSSGDSNRRLAPRRLELPLTLRLCKRYLSAEDHSKEDDRQSQLERLQFAVQVVLKYSGEPGQGLALGERRNENYWLLAAGFLVEQIDEIGFGGGWSKTQLDTLERYLSEAKSFEAKQLEAKLYEAKEYETKIGEINLEEAFLHYRRAEIAENSEIDNTIDREQALRDALTKIDESVERLVANLTDSKSFKHLYDAYRRQSNILLILAFESPLSEKKALLEAAYRRASDAVTLIEQGDVRRDASGQAHIAMGNALEDLAYYCDPVGSGARLNRFAEAIDAFRSVQNIIGFENGLLARASLARCQFRLASITTRQDAKLELLKEASASLGVNDTSERIGIQIEWLFWKGRIDYSLATFAQGRLALDLTKEAMKSFSDAIALLREHSHSIAELHYKQTYILAYVEALELLGPNANGANPREALNFLNQNLDSPRPSLFWSTRIRECGLLKKLGEWNEIVSLAGDVSQESISSGFKHDSERSAEGIARLALYVLEAGQAKNFGETPFVDSDKARQALVRLQRAVSQSKNYQATEVSDRYLRLLDAAIICLDEKSTLVARIESLLEALPAENFGELEGSYRTFDNWRLLIAQQFFFFFENKSADPRPNQEYELVSAALKRGDSFAQDLGRQFDIIIALPREILQSDEHRERVKDYKKFLKLDT